MQRRILTSAYGVQSEKCERKNEECKTELSILIGFVRGLKFKNALNEFLLLLLSFPLHFVILHLTLFPSKIQNLPIRFLTMLIETQFSQSVKHSFFDHTRTESRCLYGLDFPFSSVSRDSDIIPEECPDLFAILSLIQPKLNLRTNKRATTNCVN